MKDVDPNELMVARGVDLIEAEIDGELVGLHVDNGNFYAFNPTATRIWQLIERPRSLGALCDRLTELFAVDPFTCETEVRALLLDLANDGIVKLAKAG